MPVSDRPESGRPAPLALAALRGVRITATPAAIDAVTWPHSALLVRIAPDDAFVIDATIDDAAVVADHDPHAIIEDEPMFRGTWLDDAQFAALVDRLEWPLPAVRPALAQGMVSGLAIKLCLLADRTLLIVSASVLHEIPDRLGAVA